MAMAGEISDKFGIKLKQKQREDLHMTPSNLLWIVLGVTSTRSFYKTSIARS